MSSSVFIDNTSLTNEAVDYASTSDSNLVVVYGKNGISFDDKGLENLIEEKKISSISVIRLTSPTPSMEDEEAKLEEMLRRQELNSGDSSDDDVKHNRGSDSARSDDNNEGCESSSVCGENQKADRSTEDSENDTDEKKISRRKKVNRQRSLQSNLNKQKRTLRKRNRMRPEIVGLRLEEFYPPEDAHEIIKEALKMAGLGPDRKSKEDFEFQLFVIRNDHCYTPFTSPTQMKAKIAAEKLEIEKQGSSRKAIGGLQATSGGKQMFARKKLYQKPESTGTKAVAPPTVEKEKNKSKKDKDASGNEYNNAVSSNDECDHTNGEEENSENTLSGEESGETDNDRDSDLDFDVNNPKGRRRKFKVAKIIKRNPAFLPKPNQKTKRIQPQDEQAETIKQSHTASSFNRSKPLVKSTPELSRISIRSTPTKISHINTGPVAISSQSKVLSPNIASLPPIPRKAIENKCITSTASSPITPHKTLTITGSSQVISSPQSHMEIVINKQIMSSPRTKGFTELSSLIERSDNKETLGIVETQKQFNPVSAPTVFVAQKPQVLQKGFMPIGLETAATNQLPVQISIQTHQSSSELEAEHDKQLDLINSIVQDELKKPNEVVAPETNINENQNIPELVKMLESTEKVLEKNNIPKKGDSIATNINDSRLCGSNLYASETARPNEGTIADIDINNASLLATPDGDDELPEDILQLVDMIQDEKSLQDVLSVGDCSETVGTTSSANTNQKLPPLTLISQERTAFKSNILEDIPHSSKSIIQMSISNLPAQCATPHTSIASSYTPPPKTMSLVRSEPIKIVRGNGRVITLPPIEAPTTRAKRRAQVQPTSIIQHSVIGTPFTSGTPINVNETSLDSSIHSNASVISSSSIGHEKKAQDNTNRRRASKEINATNTSAGYQKSKGRNSASKKGKSKHQSEVEASESANEDDDDPNKLWCICRQPHNNRFMICCDACEDWFHGTCVSITKAMGLEMEQKGIDWTCPKCVKKQEEKKQPKITDMLAKKPTEMNFLQAGTYTIAQRANAHPIKVATTEVNIPDANQLCINQSQMPSTEITQTIIDTTKTKLQPGQFINLKDLSSGGKKVIIQTAANSSSGQKKLFVTTQPLRPNATTQVTPIRTIAVVKHIPGRGNQINPHQSIKVIRTISPNKTFQQTTTTASGSISKSDTATDPSTNCIVCKKHARVNSIYCSDDCIRKHAQNALNTFMTKSQSEVETPFVSNTLDEKTKKKQKGLFEDLLSMADRKPKVERVNVYERKSGRILTGSSAPTVSNLKKWLQENPTFEVVQPGSLQALDIEKKKLRVHHSSSPTIAPKSTTSPPPLKLLPLSSPVPQKGDVSRSNSPQTPVTSTIKQTQSPQLKTNKNILDFVKSSSPSTSSRPGTPKQLQKYPQNVSIKPDKNTKQYEDSKSGKEKTNTAKKISTAESCGSKTTNNDGEPIRHLVRRTLKEQLLIRTKDEDVMGLNQNPTDSSNELDFHKLSPEEIEEFANTTELEMYNYFNKDTGIKYKAKYRSLIFNIKDRKNHTLFAKICRKQIEPKQLIRMTPDEMASQELSQWRRQENKHQLEMIKKSELDLLSCAKNYVLKTHKGEEVIESKSAEYETLDLSIPVEDVVAALNKTDFDQEPSVARPQNSWIDADSTLFPTSSFTPDDKLRPSKEKERDKDREKEKDRHRDRDRIQDGRERERRHKSKDSHRDKSHSRKRSRSRSRSRSRERNEKRHKSSHKDEKREREKDRGKDRSERDQHDVKLTDKKSEKKPVIVSKLREMSSTKKHSQHEPHSSNSLDSYNLVDQILESTKTVEEAANLVSDRDRDLEMIRKTSETPVPHHSISSTTKDNADSFVIDIPAPPNYVESDQEPTSTVSIPTPPHDPYSRFTSLTSPSLDDTNRYNASTLWTGDINMVDVASFQLSIQSVLGNCSGLSKLLPKELDVVGRIGPETVWDYISKIKKSPNKEIVIIRLLPSSESETSAYKILYEYLDNRNRLGVVKSVSPFIKDFYIYPLGSGKQMPSVLRPSEPVDFYDDPCRPDILIGIIIRVVGKRQNIIGQITTSIIASSSPSGHSKNTNRTNELDSSQSPPGSPKLKKRRQSISSKEIDVDAIIKAPIVSKSQKVVTTTVTPVVALTDADEPYSPGGSSDDDVPLLPVKIPPNSKQMQSAEDELKRKMEEINRQIAAQEMEIAGLLTGETSKFGSNTSKTSKVLANIAIPSNLSQILASIKPTMLPQDELPAVPPPPPLIGSLINAATSSTSITVDEIYKTESKASIKTKTSRLANLSEAELLSMVPDDIAIGPKPPPPGRYEEPPPPGV